MLLIFYFLAFLLTLEGYFFRKYSLLHKFLPTVTPLRQPVVNFVQISNTLWTVMQFFMTVSFYMRHPVQTATNCTSCTIIHIFHVTQNTHFPKRFVLFVSLALMIIVEMQLMILHETDRKSSNVTICSSIIDYIKPDGALPIPRVIDYKGYLIIVLTMQVPRNTYYVRDITGCTHFVNG